jgi:PAS domain S-box-containing protein
MAEQSTLAERILNQVADAVISTDHSGAITRWNRASAALFGWSTEEVLGQSVEVIIPEHLRAAHWRGFDAAMANGVTKLQGRPTLTRALHKSGRRLYVEMTFAIVKGDTEREVLGAGRHGPRCNRARRARARCKPIIMSTYADRARPEADAPVAEWPPDECASDIRTPNLYAGGSPQR